MMPSLRATWKVRSSSGNTQRGCARFVRDRACVGHSVLFGAQLYTYTHTIVLRVLALSFTLY